MSLMMGRSRSSSSRLDCRISCELGGAARPRQRHLRAADQVGERRAQLVRDVGVEGLELPVGVFEAAERAVEGDREVGQLDRQARGLQALRLRLRAAAPAPRPRAASAAAGRRARSSSRAPSRRAMLASDSATRAIRKACRVCRYGAESTADDEAHRGAILQRLDVARHGADRCLDARQRRSCRCRRRCGPCSASPPGPCRTGSAGRRSGPRSGSRPSEGVSVSILACTRAQRSSVPTRSIEYCMFCRLVCELLVLVLDQLVLEHDVQRGADAAAKVSSVDRREHRDEARGDRQLHHGVRLRARPPPPRALPARSPCRGWCAAASA